MCAFCADKTFDKESAQRTFILKKAVSCKWLTLMHLINFPDKILLTFVYRRNIVCRQDVIFENKKECNHFVLYLAQRFAKHEIVFASCFDRTLECWSCFGEWVFTDNKDECLSIWLTVCHSQRN